MLVGQFPIHPAQGRDVSFFPTLQVGRWLFPDDLSPRRLSFAVLKWQQEYHLSMKALSDFLERAQVVVQGEQGVDIVVEPVTSEWLQQNYEDHCCHYACTAYCARAGACRSPCTQTRT